MLREIVIDKRVLNGFKRRALKSYPREFIEIIYGEIIDSGAYVYGFGEFRHQATRAAIYPENDSSFSDDQEEYPHPIIGTVHSHPDFLPVPSECDWANSREEGEIAFGICGIRQTKSGRRFVSWAFFDPKTEQKLDLVIAE